MKQIHSYILSAFSVLALTLSTASCTDYLDKTPESDISDTEAYKDFHNF